MDKLDYVVDGHPQFLMDKLYKKLMYKKIKNLNLFQWILLKEDHSNMMLNL